MTNIARLARVSIALMLAGTASLAQQSGQGGEKEIDLRQEDDVKAVRFEAVCRTPNLTVLWLRGPECRKETVPFLSLARNLRILHVEGMSPDVLPAFFRTLTLMPRLKGLDLTVSGNPEAMKGLRELAQLDEIALSGLADDGSAGPLFPPKLKALTLADASLAPAAWSNLSEMPLESLRLYDMTLRDNVMRYLSAMTGLRRLDMPGTECTPEALLNLRQLRRLELLDISPREDDNLITSGVTSEVLETLGKSLTELKDLRIRSARIRDFTCLKAFPKLKVLDARGIKFPIKTTEFADFIKDARGLEMLYLADSSGDHDGFLFDAIRQAPRLKVLVVGASLSGSAWGDSGLLSRLDGHPTLESLRVLNLRRVTNYVTPLGGAVRKFPNLPRLDFLVFEGCDIEETGLKDLVKLPRLENLSFLGCRWQEGRGLDAFQGQATIKTLTLQGTDLEGRRTEPLGTMKRLEQLDLSSTGLTGEVLSHLQAVRSLRSLVLDDCEVVDRDLRALEDFAPLETLSLARTSVTDRGTETISGVFTLEALSLEGTSITKNSLEPLARMKRLQKLNVKDTPLGRGDDLVHLKESMPGCVVEPR